MKMCDIISRLKTFWKVTLSCCTLIIKLLFAGEADKTLSFDLEGKKDLQGVYVTRNRTIACVNNYESHMFFIDLKVRIWKRMPTCGNSFVSCVFTFNFVLGGMLWGLLQVHVQRFSTKNILQNKGI